MTDTRVDDLAKHLFRVLVTEPTAEIPYASAEFRRLSHWENMLDQDRESWRRTAAAALSWMEQPDPVQPDDEPRTHAPLIHETGLTLRALCGQVGTARIAVTADEKVTCRRCLHLLAARAASRLAPGPDRDHDILGTTCRRCGKPAEGLRWPCDRPDAAPEPEKITTDTYVHRHPDGRICTTPSGDSWRIRTLRAGDPTTACPGLLCTRTHPPTDECPRFITEPT